MNKSENSSPSAGQKALRDRYDYLYDLALVGFLTSVNGVDSGGQSHFCNSASTLEQFRYVIG
jgi:hypothetical protein